MTIDAQLIFPRRTPPSTPVATGRRAPGGLRGAPESHDRPTVASGTERHGPVDACALLHHRTRARSIALADAPPGRYLSAQDGEDVRLIPLDQPIVRIGRGLAADVRLEDLRVSRRHAIIAQRGDGVRVLDDRSFNGTHLNGRAVTVGYLNDGDVLRLGRVVLRFVEISPPVPEQPIRRFPRLVEIRAAPYTSRVSQ